LPPDVPPPSRREECFRTQRRVEFRDTDAAGIVHFSAFMLWMESVEHELLRTVDVKVVDEHSDGRVESWPRVSVSCDYHSAVRFGDVVDVEAWVEAIGRSSVTYRFHFRHGERSVAEGRVVAVRCLIQTGISPRAVPVPDAIAARLSRYASGVRDAMG
jgi:acyl-CoA thioester hydrolase